MFLHQVQYVLGAQAFQGDVGRPQVVGQGAARVYLMMMDRVYIHHHKAGAGTLGQAVPGHFQT